MRKPLIAGNWKMHKTVPEAVALVEQIRSGLGDSGGVEVLVVPPFTALHSVAQLLRGTPIALGAQNMHWEKEGAFTGEVSPIMLRDVGCTYVILGHSERRHIFEETDERLGKKARAAVDHAITPLICVGETLAERESNRTLEVVERQIDRALRFLKPDEVARIVVSYEPVWAIGTGHAATPEQAQDVQAFIRKRVAITHGDAVARALRILYGGSVSPQNIGPLMAQGDVDGALVGGACLKAESFLQIIRYPR
jgi:triosephosphate isomerase (TIM)